VEYPYEVLAAPMASWAHLRNALTSVNIYCMSDSRAALLAAAAEEFAKNGLKGTRIQAIVKRAGVNERMIYHHFGNKEGLYAAAVADQRYGIAEAWSPILEEAAAMEPYEGMRYALGGFFDTITARPLLLSLLMHEWLSDVSSSSLPGAGALPAPMRKLYERGQSQGVFPAEVPFEVAYGAVVGALVALVIFFPRFAQAVHLGAEADPVLMRDQIVGQLLDGMTGPRRD
jgi:AcrR family transcriptional regulator